METELTNPEVYCTESEPASVAAPDAKTLSGDRNEAAPGNTEIVRNLTHAYFDWEEEIRVHDSELTTIEDCTKYLATLARSTRLSQPPHDLFARGITVKAWYEGMVLTRVKPLPRTSDDGKTLQRAGLPLPLKADGTHMTWEEWLGLIAMHHSTAYWRRRFFDRCPVLDEALELGYDEAMRELIPSYGESHESVPLCEADAVDSNAPATPDAEGSSSNSAPRVLRLSDVRGNFERILQSLEFMAECLPEAQDLTTNPDVSKAYLADAPRDRSLGDLHANKNQIDAFQLYVAAVTNALAAFDKSRRDTYARVCDYEEQGRNVEEKQRES